MQAQERELRIPKATRVGALRLSNTTVRAEGAFAILLRLCVTSSMDLSDTHT